jgi:hypothetical protein
MTRSQSAAAVLARFDGFAMEFGGHRFDLGPLQFYAPKMRLINMPELKAALGTGVDPEARWECFDGEHIYIQRMTESDDEAAA